MITKPITYTRDFVFEEVCSILEGVLNNKDIFYIGEVFEEKEYSRQRFSEWAKTFEKDEEISDTIKRIKDILESRINVGGLKGNLNSTMTIFNLKNNYNWKDKTETDITSKGEVIPIYGGLSGHDSNSKNLQTKEED